MALILI
ncbi:hypothetical protein SCAR479_13859 [Seiridium cardinale]